jgi:hypothetical protein
MFNGKRMTICGQLPLLARVACSVQQLPRFWQDFAARRFRRIKEPDAVPWLSGHQ